MERQPDSAGHRGGGISDIVAIDQACADLVNAQTSIANTMIKKTMGPGEDKIRAMHDFDWTVQLEYAEKLGLGSRNTN